MKRSPETTQTAQAARVILASPRTLFRAYLDAETMAGWRSVDGAEVSFSDFQARPGGGYRVSLRAPDASLGAELGGELDVIVEFAELAGQEKIVEVIRPLQLAGELTLTTTLEPDRDGTRVPSWPKGISRLFHRKS